MLKFVEKVERVIITTLLISLLLVVIYMTIVFLGLLFSGILSGIENSFSDNHILKHVHRIFGGFLTVLIGIELLHTIKVYLKNDVIPVQVVLLVALIGVSRHVIDLDVEHLEPGALYSASALIIALSVGYYLIKLGMAKKQVD